MRLTHDADPIPDTIRELFDTMISFASVGRLGVMAATDKATGSPRFTLVGYHDEALVPFGFLSTTAGEEVIPPGLTGTRPTIIIFDEVEDARDYADLARWADDGGLV